VPQALLRKFDCLADYAVQREIFTLTANDDSEEDIVGWHKVAELTGWSVSTLRNYFSRNKNRLSLSPEFTIARSGGFSDADKPLGPLALRLKKLRNS